MAHLSGEHDGKLDAKGRINLPSRLKSGLSQANGNILMISRGMEKCLVVYPVLEYEKIYSRVAGMNEFNQEHRLLQRAFFSRFNEVELDNNGRFLVPKSMLTYAELDKDVIFVGLGNRMEMWNPELYEQNLIKDQQQFAQLTEKFLGDNPENLK
jgi:MraZ protein